MDTLKDKKIQFNNNGKPHNHLVVEKSKIKTNPLIRMKVKEEISHNTKVSELYEKITKDQDISEAVS